MINFKNKKGFTLIELLVVIAIIGILTAIISANLFQAKSKSRDAKRVSDLAQMQLAMELFFDRCNKYPAVSSSIPNINDSCSTSTGTIHLYDFISQIPTPPTAGDYTYAISGDYQDYVLRAKLENNNAVLSDDVDTTLYTLSCDDSSLYYCVVPK